MAKDSRTRTHSGPEDATNRRPSAATTVGIVVVLALAGLGCVESAFFYHPSRAPFATPPSFEDVWFTSADGVRLHGWFVAGREIGRGPAVLHTHGNTGSVRNQAYLIPLLAEAGISGLVFDYRGYGRSDPPPAALNRDDLLADSRAALAYLRSRPEVDPGRVGVFGNSLGGVFALALAAEDPGIEAVVCSSTFSTWQGVAHDHVPLLGPIFVAPGLDPADSLRSIRVPILLVHGDTDTVVPFEHLRRLAGVGAAEHLAMTIEVVPHGGHSNIMLGRVAQRVVRFFVRHL